MTKKQLALPSFMNTCILSFLNSVSLNCPVIVVRLISYTVATVDTGEVYGYQGCVQLLQQDALKTQKNPDCLTLFALCRFGDR